MPLQPFSSHIHRCGSFVRTVVGALLSEWSNTIVLILSILFLRTYTNGYHCKSCVACIFLSLAVTLLSLHIVPLLNFITALILMFVGSSIILAIAPTNSPQMHLTETEMTAMLTVNMTSKSAL